MKKLLALIAIAILVSSCSSNEDKAKKLVKEDLNTTLHDFSSYEPVEWSTLEETRDFSKEPEERKNKMIELTMKTLAYSSGSRGLLNEEKKEGEYDEKYKAAKKSMDSLNALVPVSGYMISHKFRSKTLGGNMKLTTIQYKLDKDLTKVVDRKSSEEK